MTKKLWTAIITIGLAGQFAWTVENMYFNVFLYNTISTNPDYIATMVSVSATVATLTTIFIGALSDRLGKRKLFISLGYIIWAFSLGVFAFISPESMNGVHFAAIAVIVMDAVMTFFGSTANDACFNAYVTERVDTKDRTKVEGVIQVLPLISMLVIFGGLDGMTQKGHWPQFFLIIAGLMLAVGIASIFLVEKDAKKVKISKEAYWENILFGFRPSTLRDNKTLYIVFLTSCINGIGMQVFYPYLIIYVQQFLGINNYAVVLGILLIAASIISVLGGRVIDKQGKLRCLVPSIGFMVIGQILMYFTRKPVTVILSGIVMLGGYLLVSAILSAMIRDNTPKGKEGGVQGVRMIFQVMLPMTIGPYIGAFAIKDSNLTYIDLGVEKILPTPRIFIFAAVVTALSILPVFLLKKRENKD